MNPLRESWFGLLRVLLSVAAVVGLPTWLLATALVYDPPVQPVIEDAPPGLFIEPVPVMPALRAAAFKGLLITAAFSPIPVLLLGVGALAGRITLRRRRYDLPPESIVLRGATVSSRTERSYDARTEDAPQQRPPKDSPPAASAGE